MDVGEAIPELQPIFTFLNSHSNKLYQEGYFLKLDDQNTHRTWTECFAQLVGTVLSLWDAAELDAAGEDGEVLPKFINLTDASIKMIESLPTRSNDEQPLQNILSISTAGRNRYLLHFNSHHSLLQWTAGIRLAMFEHSTLQEAYTGALIAGKGKTLNNINLIMDRARFKTEEWVRVRFGAGVPWRRCWCVISPPDEKEYQKLQKELKKRSPYDHSRPPLLKGDIKFYDTKKDGKKQKKAKPIASITDAFSCYGIYPQAKSLIDASTLIKIEGNITIHSDPPSSTEGFIFIMPEVPPAVTGFEMLLRFLFPTWDTFGLYGRPGRLVASVLDPRSLMFAMPKHRRYGYLEILDVTNLIVNEGSGSWSERDWKRKLKELTGERMNAVEDGTMTQGRSPSRRNKRLSTGPSAPGGGLRVRVGFSEEEPAVRTSRSFSLGTPGPRTDSAPPADRVRAPNAMGDVTGHSRNNSDTHIRPNGLDGFAPHLNDERHVAGVPSRGQTPIRFANDLASTPERVSSEDDSTGSTPPVADLENMHKLSSPEPVQAPPAFAHARTARPERAYHSPELRRATSRLSMATLQQLGMALKTGIDPALTEGNNRPNSEQRRPSPGPTRGPNAFQPYTPSGRNGPPPSSNTRNTPPSGVQRKPLPGLQTSPPIQRKALPTRDDSFQSANSPEWQTRDYEYGGQGQRQQQQQGQQKYPPPRQRQGTMRSEASSNYDDAASTASPDYASTTKSSETQESVERPRAGVLKTVGDAASSDGGSHIEMPEVNFGPTLNLAHGPRTINRGPWVPPNPPAAAQSPRPYSPGGPRKTPTLTTATANITPSAGEIGHYRSESEDTLKRRSVAWQPGATIGGGAGQPAMSPEEFVHQRAAAAQMPQYATHQRTPSGNTLAQMGSPPLRRSGSQDYLTNRHSRSGSADLLKRRNSQDSSHMLSANGTGAVSSHLTAREQEHVARATGTPLISIATNNQAGHHQPGLVGAIDAREREKAQMKQGYNSQTVQNAINQRQYQHQQHQYAQQQQQYAQQQMYGAAAAAAGAGPNMSMGNLNNIGMAMSPGASPMHHGGGMGMQNMGRGGGGGF
ncbi:hypothetical protein M406DRAFT_273860, partial [Cryphonectria parasitica EP155]